MTISGCRNRSIPGSGRNKTPPSEVAAVFPFWGCGTVCVGAAGGGADDFDVSFVNGFAFAGMEQTLSLLIYLRIFPVSPVGLSAEQYDAAQKAAGRESSFYTWTNNGRSSWWG